jgi:hypothetical protein
VALPATARGDLNVVSSGGAIIENTSFLANLGDIGISNRTSASSDDPDHTARVSGRRDDNLSSSGEFGELMSRGSSGGVVRELNRLNLNSKGLRACRVSIRLVQPREDAESRDVRNIKERQSLSNVRRRVYIRKRVS